MNVFTVQVNLKHIIWIKFYAAVRLFVLFYFVLFFHTYVSSKFYEITLFRYKAQNEAKRKKKKKEKNSCTKKCPWACHGSNSFIKSWAKICADLGLQAFITFTQNSFFEYI